MANRSALALAVAASALLPFLAACDDDKASTPPPEKLCDNVPYQCAADATGLSGLSTRNMNGRVTVTTQDSSGDCSIQDTDKNVVLAFTVKLQDEVTAGNAAKDVQERLASGNGVALATPQGTGLVLSKKPDSEKKINSYWVCKGVTLDVSYKAAERLKTFTEQVATLAPCLTPTKV